MVSTPSLWVLLPDKETRLPIPPTGSRLALGRKQHPSLSHASISDRWVELAQTSSGLAELHMLGSNPLEVEKQEREDGRWVKVASLTQGQSMTVGPGHRFWIRTLKEPSMCSIVQDTSAANSEPQATARSPSPATNITEPLPAAEQHSRQRQHATQAHPPSTTQPAAVIDLTVSDDDQECGDAASHQPKTAQQPSPAQQSDATLQAATAAGGRDHQALDVAADRTHQLSPAGRAALKRAEIATATTASKRPRTDDAQQGSCAEQQEHHRGPQAMHQGRYSESQAGPTTGSVAGTSRQLISTAVAQQVPHHRQQVATTHAHASTSSHAEGSIAARQALLRRDMPFKLLKVRHVADEFNEGCLGVTLCQLLTGPMRLVVVMNYMVDFVWLMSACPDLMAAEQLVVCHGERSGAEHLVHTANALGFAHKLVLHAPPLPERWGTHHTKAFLVQYDRGMRVIIHTANAIHTDNTNKSQAIWWQDFPLKDSASPPTSAFEADLVDYCTRMKMPSQVSQRVLQLIASCDMSSARAHLVASVPGRHTGRDLYKYGHMRLRHLLKQEPLPAGAAWHTHSQLVMQCSSLGSVDEKWLSSEFVASLSAAAVVPAAQGSGSTHTVGQVLGGSRVVDMKRVFFVWPTEQEVRDSLEGWAAGGSIPGPQRNVQRDYLIQRMARFGGQALGRMRAMPHIKSYLRFLDQQIAWVMVGSHNVSKAAWGSLEKNGQQLMIRSYELGTLHTPGLEAGHRAHRHYGFSCTPPPGTAPAAVPPLQRPPVSVEFRTLHHMLQELQSRQQLPAETRQTEVPHQVMVPIPAPGCVTGSRTTAGMGDASGAQVLHVPIPLPYMLPPERYTPGRDVPWMVDAEHVGLDIVGRNADEGEPLYGHVNSISGDGSLPYFVDINQ